MNGNMRNQPAPLASPAEVEQLYTKMGTLMNNELKAICRAEKDLVSGTKIVLRNRVLKLLQNAIDRRDKPMFERIRYRVQHRGQSPPFTLDFGDNSTTPTAANTSYTARPAHPPSSSSGRTVGYPDNNVAMTFRGMVKAFKPSAFFAILDQVGVTIELPMLPEYKKNVSSTIVLTSAVIDKLKTSENYRIMLYGAADPNAYHQTDIAFPSSFEVRVNHEEVKANFKGIKNKPGTTKPADITRYIRKTPAYRNTVDVVYATTHHRFALFPYLVEMYPATRLAESIAAGKVIPKQQTLKEMRAKASDPDIDFTSSVMSLKDPVSTLRITTPCRSTRCTHTRCFDILSFMQMQEQAPTWSCPVCSKSIKYDDLAVDQYVQEILEQTPKSVDQVIIEPNGEWSVRAPDVPSSQTQQESPGLRKLNGYDEDFSDSDVEIVPSRAVSALKSETASTPLSAFRTPPFSPSASTATPNGTAGAGASRPNGAPGSTPKRRQVVDLTLSSDEDEGPPKKRRQSEAVSTGSHLSHPPQASATSRSSRHTLPSNISFSFPRSSTPSGTAAGGGSSLTPSSAVFNFNAGPTPTYGSSGHSATSPAFLPAPYGSGRADGTTRTNGYGGSVGSDTLGTSASPDRGPPRTSQPRQPSSDDQRDYLRHLTGLGGPRY